jgi:hypothetical protein
MWLDLAIGLIDLIAVDWRFMCGLCHNCQGRGDKGTIKKYVAKHKTLWAKWDVFVHIGFE